MVLFYNNHFEVAFDAVTHDMAIRGKTLGKRDE